MFFLLDQKEPKNQGLSPSTTHYGHIPLHKINSPRSFLQLNAATKWIDFQKNKNTVLEGLGQYFVRTLHVASGCPSPGSRAIPE
jgi:hypothetical protein